MCGVPGGLRAKCDTGGIMKPCRGKDLILLTFLGCAVVLLVHVQMLQREHFMKLVVMILPIEDWEQFDW